MKNRFIEEKDWDQPDVDIATVAHYLSSGEDTTHDELWLNDQEVCQYLNVSDTTLCSIRMSGKLPFSKINEYYYYTIGDIKKMLCNDFFIEESNDFKDCENVSINTTNIEIPKSFNP
jgi:hypothetical protein